MTLKEKLGIISQLVKLTLVDEAKQTPDELAFIERIAHHLKVPLFELQKALTFEYKLIPPQNEFDRILVFQKAIMLMSIDGKIEDSEIDFCKSLGLKLGLNPLATNEIIHLAVMSNGAPIPPEDILRIYSTFYN